MARIDINRIRRDHKTSVRVHDVVRATYDIYEVNGIKYLHIDSVC
jgi:hypothetical protein